MGSRKGRPVRGSLIRGVFQGSVLGSDGLGKGEAKIKEANL